MLSKEDIVQIIYSTVRIESLTDSVENAAQKIMELTQCANCKREADNSCKVETECVYFIPIE